MTALRDIGRAKINLTLEVLGRRADGFHELKSLVAFANFGDRLELDPGDGLDLEVEGPFAAALGNGNLILEAARAAQERVPGLRLGRFRLAKCLPVAAGLGGGSADAAAALRLIARANPGLIDEGTSAELARKIGSDVSVCLASRPALMSGRGEKIEPVRGFPACGVVLANPGKALATRAVYAALDAAPLGARPARRHRTARLPRRLGCPPCLCAPARQRSRSAGRKSRSGYQGRACRARGARRRSPCQALGERADLLCAVSFGGRGKARRFRACRRASRLVGRLGSA